MIPYMVPGRNCSCSSPCVVLYALHSSQLQVPGDAEETEQNNWPTEDTGLKRVQCACSLEEFVFGEPL